MAVNLYHFGKLEEKALAWVKEEGTKRFQSGSLSTLNINGKLTLAAQVLVKLGVLIARGTSVTLVGDAKLAQKIAAEPVPATVTTAVPEQVA